MSLNQILETSILGLCGGFLSGFTGLTSSSFILAGISILHLIPDYKTVLGTLMYIINFPKGIGSVWLFYKENKINYFFGNIIIISMIIGSYLGTEVILSNEVNVSTKFIKYLSAFIALSAGIYFLIDATYFTI